MTTPTTWAQYMYYMGDVEVQKKCVLFHTGHRTFKVRQLPHNAYNPINVFFANVCAGMGLCCTRRTYLPIYIDGRQRYLYMDDIQASLLRNTYSKSEVRKAHCCFQSSREEALFNRALKRQILKKPNKSLEDLHKKLQAHEALLQSARQKIACEPSDEEERRSIDEIGEMIAQLRASSDALSSSIQSLREKERTINPDTRSEREIEEWFASLDEVYESGCYLDSCERWHRLSQKVERFRPGLFDQGISWMQNYFQGQRKAQARPQEAPKVEGSSVLRSGQLLSLANAATHLWSSWQEGGESRVARDIGIHALDMLSVPTKPIYVMERLARRILARAELHNSGFIRPVSARSFSALDIAEPITPYVYSAVQLWQQRCGVSNRRKAVVRGTVEQWYECFEGVLIDHIEAADDDKEALRSFLDSSCKEPLCEKAEKMLQPFIERFDELFASEILSKELSYQLSYCAGGVLVEWVALPALSMALAELPLPEAALAHVAHVQQFGLLRSLARSSLSAFPEGYLPESFINLMYTSLYPAVGSAARLWENKTQYNAVTNKVFSILDKAIAKLQAKYHVYGVIDALYADMTVRSRAIFHHRYEARPLLETMRNEQEVAAFRELMKQFEVEIIWNQPEELPDEYREMVALCREDNIDIARIRTLSQQMQRHDNDQESLCLLKKTFQELLHKLFEGSGVHSAVGSKTLAFCSYTLVNRLLDSVMGRDGIKTNNVANVLHVLNIFEVVVDNIEEFQQMALELNGIISELKEKLSEHASGNL